MEADPDRDLELLARIAEGDCGAFGELYDRHAPVVLGVLTRMLGRRDVAEELMQEAFLQAWVQAARYRRERGMPRAWLLMMARSRAIDRLRSSRSRGEREQVVAAESAPVEPVGTRALEAGETRERVVSALGRLPEEQRRCIELAFYGGMSQRQVAERLKQPLGTVKSRILLGMKRLRAELAPSTS